jgi:flavodoxin
MTRKRRVLLFAAGATVLGIGAGGAFTLMAVKDQTYVPSAHYEPQGALNSDVAVVYYSRSGHSEAVAREVARKFNAPIARIDADYPRNFSGQWKAVSDSKARVVPQIRVEPIDVAVARRVFLVSPTWMFRPATPLWAYVEQSDFRGKEVLLIATGNSRYEQAEIHAFAKRVDARGGRFVDHIFLRRGRTYWQKSREALLKEVRAETDRFS